MSYRIVIYAPDRHIRYDARTPDRVGVGGGVTARIRVARSLVQAGHRVTMIANCPTARVFDGVAYVPLAAASKIESDVLVATTSGGDLDLRPLRELPVEARLRIAWVHGPWEPKGLKDLEWDFVYAPSNFLLDVVRKDWGIAPSKTFVTYNGATQPQPQAFRWRARPARHSHRLVYASHPSKGLESALGVLRLLREIDGRFELHIYGSRLLWGQQDEGPPPDAPGVVYHGMVAQPTVVQGLREATYSIHLQIRDEGMPLVGVEALRAGCLILASPVGGYSEIIRHGYNGFLVPGNHLAASTWQRAANLIQYLVDHPTYAEFIRRNAEAAVWDWQTMAETWLGHWDWALAGGRKPSSLVDVGRCGICGGEWLPLADGYHCTGCGVYRLWPA